MNTVDITKVTASVEDVGAWLIGLKIWSSIESAEKKTEDKFWIQVSDDRSFDAGQTIEWERAGDLDTENVLLNEVLGTKLTSGMELYGSDFFFRAGVGPDENKVNWSESVKIEIKQRR